MYCVIGDNQGMFITNFKHERFTAYSAVKITAAIFLVNVLDIPIADTATQYQIDNEYTILLLTSASIGVTPSSSHKMIAMVP